MVFNKQMEEALEALLVIARRTSGDKKLQENIMAFTKNKIPFGKLEELLDNDVELEIYFKPVELYWIMKAYYTFAGAEYLKVTKYFTDLQIKDFENYYIDEATISDTIIINNVKKVKGGIYHCYEFPFEQIKSSYESGIIGYDFRMQREGTLKERYGEVITRATVVKKNVLDIKKSMKNNTFTPNTITWNVLDNEADSIEYDENTETLSLTRSKETVINIIDGYHRTLAISQLLDEGYEVEKDYMFLTILNYTVEEAQRYIRQEQQGTKLSESQQKVYKNDINVSVAKNINITGTEFENSLKNKIADIEAKVHKYNKQLITMSSLSDTIETYYSELLKKPKDVKKVSNWIVEFFNEIIGEKEEYFDNIVEAKNETVLVYNNMLCAFVGLSAYVYKNNENWETKLEELLNKIDFDIENPLFVKNNITSKTWNRQGKKGIDTIVKYLINEYK